MPRGPPVNARGTGPEVSDTWPFLLITSGRLTSWPTRVPALQTSFQIAVPRVLSASVHPPPVSFYPSSGRGRGGLSIVPSAVGVVGKCPGARGCSAQDSSSSTEPAGARTLSCKPYRL